MKKYQWNSTRLKKKATLFNNLMLLFGAIAIACLYLLPEGMKVYNLIPLTVAMIMLVLSWRLQARDKQLRKTK